jgi:hypothetical protein
MRAHPPADSYKNGFARSDADLARSLSASQSFGATGESKVEQLCLLRDDGEGEAVLHHSS